MPHAHTVKHQRKLAARAEAQARAQQKAQAEERQRLEAIQQTIRDTLAAKEARAQAESLRRAEHERSIRRALARQHVMLPESTHQGRHYLANILEHTAWPYLRPVETALTFSPNPLLD